MRRKIGKKGLLAAVLAALMLSVTACGGEDKDKASNAIAEGVLMVVGNKSVSYEEAFAYVYMLKQQYEPGMSGDIWNFQVEEGVTFEDYAKDRIVNELTQLKIICQEAEELEIALTEDEMQEAKSMAGDFMETVTAEDALTYGLTKELMTSVYEDHILAQKVYEISTNEVNTNIPDEEAKQITVQYLMVMTKGTDKNGQKVDMNEEEKKQAKKKAKSLYKKAKDLDTSFYAFADSNTDAKEIELTFGKSDMPKDFGDIAMTLKTEEMSKLITGENGYYIVYCVSDYDEEATLAKKEEIIAKAQDEMFRRKYTEWSENAKLIISTAVWDAMEF